MCLNRKSSNILHPDKGLCYIDSMFFGVIRVRRIIGGVSILLLAAYTALNWFARQDPEFQQKLYRHLPEPVIRRVYYLSNASASVSDFIGVTGSDCFAEFKGGLPVDGPLCGGLPRNMKSRELPKNVQYLKRQGFTVCYSPELRHPLWVAVKVHAGECKPETPRPSFKRDPVAGNCPAPDDYAKSGYDRGHMAPNRAIAICYGPEAQRESFLLSNICPQRPGMNRGPWRKMEHMVADIWPERFGDIYVISGAHSDDKSEYLKSKVNIPDGFYKIVVAQRDGRIYAMAVYMSQGTGYGAFPRTKLVSIDEIEKMTGLDFLSDLPDEVERELESRRATRLWPASWRGCIKLVAAHFREY